MLKGYDSYLFHIYNTNMIIVIKGLNIFQVCNGYMLYCFKCEQILSRGCQSKLLEK
uniref:Uncharacterized protein n=1 Tax=Octopus bimaculoides TaxID=37653 RepID=A0A0L8ICW6_OCTBM